MSSSSLGACRAALVRAVWSSKMPLANTPAVLSLLDAPVGVDVALHVVWVRFRMMRRYLAYCPDEEPRTRGHGPVYFLFVSAAELGFAWDGGEGLGSGFFISPVWSCPAFLFFHFGCLAIWYFSHAI